MNNLREDIDKSEDKPVSLHQIEKLCFIKVDRARNPI